MARFRSLLLVCFVPFSWGNDILPIQQYTASPRSGRFPSVDERVRLYMSNWYSPPCQDNHKGVIRFQSKNATTVKIQAVGSSSSHNILSTIEPDRIFFLDQQSVVECSRNELAPDPAPEKNHNTKEAMLILKNMRLYCADTVASLVPALHHVNQERLLGDKSHPPLMVQFGDLLKSHVYGFLDVPHFKKFRPAAASTDLAKATHHNCISKQRTPLKTADGANHLQPIIWKLSVARHYARLSDVEDLDTPWALKKSMAIFRGQLTGSLDGYNRHRDDEQNCLEWTRCRLVYKHSNSTLVDAKLTSTRKRMPNSLNGVKLVSKKDPISTLMEYKAIIMLEGNDVSSGLKWALLSQSVVLMPKPKYSSWAMEELLVPWLHYVPLNEHATDVEAKMQWVKDNDELARRIAEQGSLWIEDLCFHPDAAWEDKMIQEEMVRRYMAHFRPF